MHRRAVLTQRHLAALAAPCALMALILVVDRWLLRRANTLLMIGIVDEIAHLATSILLVMGTWAGWRLWQRTRGRSTQSLPARQAGAAAIAALVAGNLIDIDHLPATLGWYGFTDGTPRPYSHSLTTVALLLALGLTLARRQSSRTAGWALAGAALGVSGHLLRDVTGRAAVALLWPVDWSGVRWPWWIYWVVLLAATAAWLAALTVVRRPPPADAGAGANLDALRP